MWKYISFYLSIIAASYSAIANPSKVNPEVDKVIQGDGKVNVVVLFKTGIKSTLRDIPRKRSGVDRGQHIKSIVDALEKNAAVSQESVLQVLSSRSGDGQDFKYFKRYPTSNLIYIKEASPSIIQKIAEDDQVSEIRVEPIVKLVSPQTPTVEFDGIKPTNENETASANVTVTRHLELIQIPEAWEELGGKKGEGILVGSIDSGIRYTHEALRDNFVGIDYGWLDTVDGLTEPADADISHGGHGTNVMGIIVGTGTPNQTDKFGRPIGSIGIAPGAKWMTCKACALDLGCPYEALRDCIKWIECPTMLNGSNPDCSKAPHIINNSWESVHGETGYSDDILRWRAMGILPVFAIGNQGQKCNTSSAPGEYPFVLGVGSTDINDTLDDSSGIGPAWDGGIKPDLVAPGQNVWSCSPFGDADYDISSGTSFATPHVSGLLALLLVRNPDLTYEEAYDLLTQNTEREHLPKVKYWENDTCTEIPDNVVPSNWFGYGRINALKTVKAQTALLQAGKK